MNTLANFSGRSVFHIDTESKEKENSGEQMSMSALDWLQDKNQAKEVSDIAYHFACFIHQSAFIHQSTGQEARSKEKEGGPNVTAKASLESVARQNLLVLVAAKLMHQLQMQDSCLNLVNLSSPDLLFEKGVLYEKGLLKDKGQEVDRSQPPYLPEQERWRDELAALKFAVRDVSKLEHGSNNETETRARPFVLCGNLIYLSRYYEYETQVLSKVNQSRTSSIYPLKALSESGLLPASSPWYLSLNTNSISHVLDPLFGEPSEDIAPSADKDPLACSNLEPDWQRVAVENALTKPFSIICGGPGTGKTTTVVKLLASLITLRRQATNTPLTIKLAAPTGKAAQRLSESIGDSLNKLNLAPEIRVAIPNQALTLHRLLKPRGLNEFHHNEMRPIVADLVIVDEASMVDLGLMARLIRALPQDCQLILLGDKEQLASVEAGNVLAEICGASLTDARQSTNDSFITELKKSWRFDGKGMIGRFANCIKSGQADQAVELLSQLTDEDEIRLMADSQKPFAALMQQVVSHQESLYELADGMTSESEQDKVPALFKHLGRFQLLACVRQGERGLDGINQEVRRRLVRKGHVPWQEQHYHGRPIMITENAYHLNLFNGDIGLELFDPVTGQLMAYFPSGAHIEDEKSAEAGFVKLFCQRLPQHETLYAMTVHKSQGSEFQRVAMILPEKSQSLSRELLYTGLTRAKQHFTLLGSLESVQFAIANRTQRQSGIGYRLEHGLG